MKCQISGLIIKDYYSVLQSSTLYGLHSGETSFSTNQFSSSFNNTTGRFFNNKNIIPGIPAETWSWNLKPLQLIQSYEEQWIESLWRCLFLSLVSRMSLGHAWYWFRHLISGQNIRGQMTIFFFFSSSSCKSAYISLLSKSSASFSGTVSNVTLWKCVTLLHMKYMPFHSFQTS